MKKIVLAALNAKYIHSNLALRYLSRFQDNYKKHDIITREFTINQRPDFIVEELFRLQPDVVLFSAYIWNVETLRQLCPLLKKVMPDCIIGFGGPEVSYESEAFLKENPSVDLVQRGEGEISFTKLLEHWDTGVPASLEEIGSLTFRKEVRSFLPCRKNLWIWHFCHSLMKRTSVISRIRSFITSLPGDAPISVAIACLP